MALPSAPKASRTGIQPGKKTTSLWKNLWSMRSLYLMLLPGIIYYVVYKYVPMYGVLIAFKDYDILSGIVKSPWADPWYKHFQFFFESPYFNQLLTNTFLISFYKTVWGTFLAIFVAVLIHEGRIPWLNRIVQTLSYMPHFLSYVIIYGIAIAFFSETSGLINRLIVENGGSAIPFLSSESYFRSVLVGTDVWKDLGWGAIVYLAAMSSIDSTLYEAARIEGAGRLRRIWHITLPGIRSVIILLLVLKIGSVLDAGFEQIYIMYNVQVYPVADIIDTWVYRVGLEQLNFSLATAVGLFKSVIGLILVYLSNKLARKWGGNLW
ncbi:ABC transporter permease [Paenibacillus herberti]|uniref:Polysaccharide ABC transporter ATP-binding protein n=1 Tax=Paenibacillus herberti TaxID=1619309 RepID=A0A229NUN6_9BACL|nr:polysaccharide ABC transporter ATP-binding protein [Paenibacillus herberti]